MIKKTLAALILTSSLWVQSLEIGKTSEKVWYTRIDTQFNLPKNIVFHRTYNKKDSTSFGMDRIKLDKGDLSLVLQSSLITEGLDIPQIGIQYRNCSKILGDGYIQLTANHKKLSGEFFASFEKQGTQLWVSYVPTLQNKSFLDYSEVQINHFLTKIFALYARSENVHVNDRSFTFGVRLQK